MGKTRKNVITLVLVPLFFIGMVQAARAYTDFIDQFSVTKNGSTLFTDPFNNGSPPPSAPNFVDGTAASYAMTGTMGPEVNNPTGGPGQLTLDSSGAILKSTAVGSPLLVQSATLLTGISSASSHELTSSDTFSTTGVFNLVIPTTPQSAYGVIFSDGTSTYQPDAWVLMAVARIPSNQLVIELIRQNFQAGTLTVIASTPLDTSHTGEIALTLTKASAADAITGSFTYLDNGTTGTFSNTTSIFGIENYAQAQFQAFAAVPEPSAILFLVPGLVGLAAVRRRLKK
jgi:hypothetical protein